MKMEISASNHASWLIDLDSPPTRPGVTRRQVSLPPCSGRILSFSQELKIMFYSISKTKSVECPCQVGPISRPTITVPSRHSGVRIDFRSGNERARLRILQRMENINRTFTQV